MRPYHSSYHTYNVMTVAENPSRGITQVGHCQQDRRVIINLNIYRHSPVLAFRVWTRTFSAHHCPPRAPDIDVFPLRFDFVEQLVALDTYN